MNLYQKGPYFLLLLSSATLVSMFSNPLIFLSMFATRTLNIICFFSSQFLLTLPHFLSSFSLHWAAFSPLFLSHLPSFYIAAILLLFSSCSIWLRVSQSASSGQRVVPVVFWTKNKGVERKMDGGGRSCSEGDQSRLRRGWGEKSEWGMEGEERKGLLRKVIWKKKSWVRKGTEGCFRKYEK